jgi:hypothetical protein
MNLPLFKYNFFQSQAFFFKIDTSLHRFSFNFIRRKFYLGPTFLFSPQIWQSDGSNELKKYIAMGTMSIAWLFFIKITE